MASWPTTLPRPLGRGYALSPADAVVRTDMEGGSAKVRRRTRARNDKLDVVWMFTDAQMTAFRAWFENDTTGASGGASWFTMTVAIGTGSVTSLDCRFIGPFKATVVGSLIWNVTAQLEVR